MELINNPWIVGIITGVPSGLIVTWLSRLLFSKKENREYQQRVSAANREVIYSIRPGISEGIIPTTDVVNALIESTARRYGISRQDAYGPKEIAQELLKEVMDSSFISAKTKEEYCARLATIMEGPVADSGKSEVGDQQEMDGANDRYRSRLIATASVMMGALTAATTLFLAVSSNGRRETLSILPERLDILFPVISAVAIVAGMFALMQLQRDIHKRKIERQQSQAREAIIAAFDRTRREFMDATGKMKSPDD